MYLFDTNVVSALRRQEREPSAFVDWAEATEANQAFLSAITILEIEQGALRLERRDPHQGAILRRWIDGPVLGRYAGRILPADLAVARRAAALHVPDPGAIYDALIGATALIHGLTLVTRNVADFAPMGVAVLNPWESAI